jgi:cold shock CspA family protein
MATTLETKYGTVVYFNGKRGYGFLVSDEAIKNNEKETFFHVKSLLTEDKTSIRVGQRCKYLHCYRAEAKENKKDQAIAIKILPTNNQRRNEDE